MKTLEDDASLPAWLNWLLNHWPACIHRDAVATLFTIAWDEEGWYRPESVSLFYNGYFFLRVTLPFGIWVHVKRQVDLRRQYGIGWKLNGRLGAEWRKQSDASAAEGVQGRNSGQATGWARGTA